MSRLIRAVIDTQALRSNLQVLKSRAPKARVVAVVKANAYGHGLIGTARALHDADALAVARIGEGIALREAGITQPIVLLGGVFTPEEMQEAAHHAFDLVVHNERQIELLENSRDRAPLVLWLKIDTGMHRLGFAPEASGAALLRLRQLPLAPREIRLMTHLASAEEPDDAMTRAQLECFSAVTRGVSLATSIGNSAGILGSSAALGNWIRPGIALYGASPFAHASAASLGLVPVMTLETTVMATHRVARGQSVGYGAAWRAERDTRIAILAGGYADGLPRNLAKAAAVLVNGERARLAGRVSMDMIAVDIAERTDVQVGTPGVIWGAGLPVGEMAAQAGTISYELLCGVPARVAREFR